MSQLHTRGQSYDKTNWKWIKFKLVVESVLDRLPALKRLVAYCLHNIRLLKYKWEWKKQSKKRDSALDVHKIVWINPITVKYASLTEFDPWRYRGAVIDGDWDHLEKQFEDMDVYLAFKERFTEGKTWEDTSFYQLILNAINNGHFVWNCRNEDDLKRRCEKLDSLLQRIHCTGYKTQNEIVAAKKNGESVRIEEEICVNVGRNGNLIFNDGAHRLAIAKVLEIDRIPVEITVRHPEWMQFRKQILHFADEGYDGITLLPFTHPDLQDIPTIEKTDNFDFITSTLSIKQGHLLDIGDQWGYYCHRFEDMGFECYAIEIDESNVHFLEKLKRAENRNFTIIRDSVLDWSGVENIHFDVVLAFGVFDRFLRTKDTYDGLIRLLNKLDMEEMYFQTPIATETAYPDAYTNYNEDEFVNLIIENSKLNTVLQIGESMDGSKIFKIT